MSGSWLKLTRHQQAMQRAQRANRIELETRLMNAGWRATGDLESRTHWWTCPKTFAVVDEAEALRIAGSLPTTKATARAWKSKLRAKYRSSRFPRPTPSQRQAGPLPPGGAGTIQNRK